MSFKVDVTNAYLKSWAAEESASLSLEDSGLPVVNGSYILPPVIQRGGTLYALQRVGESSKFETAIRVHPQDAGDYNYMYLDADDAEKAADADRYSGALRPDSTSYQRLVDTLPTTGFKSGAEVNVSLSDADALVNSIIRRFNSRKGRLYTEVRDFLEAEVQGSAAAKELFMLLTYRGLRTTRDFELTAWRIRELMQGAGQQRHVALNHLQSICEYKMYSFSELLSPRELSVYEEAIRVVDFLLEHNFLAQMRGRSADALTATPSKSAVASLLVGRALAESYGNSTYDAFKDVDFTKLAGFSPQAGRAVANFFKEVSSNVRIKVDGEEVTGFQLEGGVECERIEVEDPSTARSLVLDFGQTVDNKFESGGVPDVFAPYFGKELLGERVGLPNNYLAWGNFLLHGGPLFTKKGFLVLRVGRARKKFDLTYSRRISPTQRHHVGEITAALVHEVDYTKDVHGVMGGLLEEASARKGRIVASVMVEGADSAEGEARAGNRFGAAVSALASASFEPDPTAVLMELLVQAGLLAEEDYLPYREQLAGAGAIRSSIGAVTASLLSTFIGFPRGGTAGGGVKDAAKAWVGQSLADLSRVTDGAGDTIEGRSSLSSVRLGKAPTGAVEHLRRVLKEKTPVWQGVYRDLGGVFDAEQFFDELMLYIFQGKDAAQRYALVLMLTNYLRHVATGPKVEFYLVGRGNDDYGHRVRRRLTFTELFDAIFSRSGSDVSLACTVSIGPTRRRTYVFNADAGEHVSSFAHYAVDVVTANSRSVRMRTDLLEVRRTANRQVESRKSLWGVGTFAERTRDRWRSFVGANVRRGEVKELVVEDGLFFRATLVDSGPKLLAYGVSDSDGESWERRVLRDEYRQRRVTLEDTDFTVDALPHLEAVVQFAKPLAEELSMPVDYGVTKAVAVEMLRAYLDGTRELGEDALRRLTRNPIIKGLARAELVDEVLKRG